MKAHSGLQFPSELCFGLMNATKDSYLLNSKVAFLKSGQNSAGISFFSTVNGVKYYFFGIVISHFIRFLTSKHIIPILLEHM